VTQAKRNSGANGHGNGKHDHHVSGRASKVYRLLMGPATRGRAIAMIRGALKDARGRVDLAASQLRVSSRTLSRWLSIAGLRKFASSQRKANAIPGPRL
jgi:hypothetical protein